MIRSFPITAALLGALTFLAPPAHAEPPPAAGPVIELAPEHDAAPPPQKPLIGLGTGVHPDLSQSLTEQRFRTAAESRSNTSIGGYGELTLTGLMPPDAPSTWTADARRLVLFVAHTFTDSIRIYTEFEFEHANEAEVEQAFVDWKLLGDKLGLRAGLILVPMGITNQYHEPPVFNGVLRPTVETAIIPSTWRELGVGFFGRPTEQLRYEVYAMTGLDPLNLGADGMARARQSGMASKAKAWAAVGRLEYEPLLGLTLGAGAYASDAGNNGSFHLRDHEPASVRFPIVGWDLDARFKRHGFEAKLLYTEWYLPQAEALMHTYDDKGLPLFDASQPVPTRMRGGYVEAGYNVLHRARTSHALVPFGRLEAYDTQAAVPRGFKAAAAFDVRQYTVGLSYRPIPQLVFKADYQYRDHSAGVNEKQANFGVGFMF